jgi:hypothetical protein
VNKSKEIRKEHFYFLKIFISKFCGSPIALQFYFTCCSIVFRVAYYCRIFV